MTIYVDMLMKTEIPGLRDRSVCDIDMAECRARACAEGGVGSGRLVIHSHRHNLKTRFELLRTLGEGTYGKVKLAVDKTTGEQVAIKYIKKTKIQDEHDLNRIRREIKIMSSLQHPHIIKVNEVFENKDKIILVMECATGGELYDYINNNKLGDVSARRIFRQIVSAVQHCHQRGIVHRDLKLENILLDHNYNAKIADFGLSNYYSHSDWLKTYCGSPLYASPEIVNGQPYYGPEVDCWSLGVVLYTLVYGTMPFDGSNYKRLRSQITNGDYYEPTNPSEAAGLVRHLLTVNAAKRATMKDILSHWWVNLGYKYMPNSEPYVPPKVLKPVPNCHNQSLSSDSDTELDSDRTDPKTDRPLKGILKKPKMIVSGLEGLKQGSKSENFDPLYGDCDSVFTGATEYSVEVMAETKITYLSKVSDTEITSSVDKDKIVFDAQRQPARSILKRKGKFSSGDSGCDLSDASRKGSAEYTIKSMDLSDIDSASVSPDCIGANTDNSNSLSNATGAFNFTGMSEQRAVGNPCHDEKQNVPCDGINVTLGVVPRKRGILKNRSQTSKEEADKRLSACSIGSNSSTDILDFSYDSSDEILSRYFRQASPRESLELNGEMYVTSHGQASYNGDVFSSHDARDVYQKALDICKNL